MPDQPVRTFASAVIAAISAAITICLTACAHPSTAESAGGSSPDMVSESDVPSASVAARTSARASATDQNMAECTASDLTAGNVTQYAFSLHYMALVGITNVSDSPCILSGYPSIEVHTKDGSKLAVNIHYVQNSPIYTGARSNPVVLEPGHTAGLYIGKIGTPDSVDSPPRCHPALNAKFFITLAGTQSQIEFSEDFACSGGNLYVSPFQTGADNPFN